jgi:hypothetical protein
MIPRDLAAILQRSAGHYMAITLTDPRQACCSRTKSGTTGKSGYPGL